MTPRVITIEVFAVRETRQSEQRLALLSRDGERSVWTCRRRIEVFQAAVAICEFDGPAGDTADRTQPCLLPAAAEVALPSRGCCGRAKSNGCQSPCEETVS
jgi:hypothetical protein